MLILLLHKLGHFLHVRLKGRDLRLQELCLFCRILIIPLSQVRLNGARGLHEKFDLTSKLVIPLSKRNSKGLPDFTVLFV